MVNFKRQKIVVIRSNADLRLAFHDTTDGL